MAVCINFILRLVTMISIIDDYWKLAVWYSCIGVSHIWSLLKTGGCTQQQQQNCRMAARIMFSRSLIMVSTVAFQETSIKLFACETINNEHNPPHGSWRENLWLCTLLTILCYDGSWGSWCPLPLPFCIWHHMTMGFMVQLLPSKNWACCAIARSASRSATCLLSARPVLLLSVGLVVCLHVGGWNGQQNPSHVVLKGQTDGWRTAPSWIYAHKVYEQENLLLLSGSCFVASKPRSTILSAWNVTCFENTQVHLAFIALYFTVANVFVPRQETTINKTFEGFHKWEYPQIIIKKQFHYQ